MLRYHHISDDPISVLSDSLESVNTRASGQSRHNQNRPRRGTPQSRHGTPQPRQGTPHSRQSTPHSRQSTPQLRHGAQREGQRGFDDYATIFDVQQGLKKGQLVEVRGRDTSRIIVHYLRMLVCSADDEVFDHARLAAVQTYAGDL